MPRPPYFTPVTGQKDLQAARKLRRDLHAPGVIHDYSHNGRMTSKVSCDQVVFMTTSNYAKPKKNRILGMDYRGYGDKR